MTRRILNFLLFVVSVSAIVIGLKVMNWVPSVIESGLLKEYSSIEEVEARLKFGRVFAPAYYPQRLEWPPAKIVAQTRPYRAVIMEYVQKGTDNVCLVISQTEIPHKPPEERLALSSVEQIVPYDFKDHRILLEVGVCNDGARCSRVSWEEKGYRIIASSRLTPVELIKIAESMIPIRDPGYQAERRR